MSSCDKESCGQKLFHGLGIRQGSYFSASDFAMDKRVEWSDSFSKAAIRGDKKRLKDSSVFIVLTQDCDIACKNDTTDSCVELLVCKSIKEKQVHHGNQFVNSVRKLHFQVEGQWYEANVDYILTINKLSLLEAIETGNIESNSLRSDVIEWLRIWRSNRYSRAALPDAFNKSVDPVLDEFLPKLIIASDDGYGTSFIRALYVSLDSFEEKESYQFKFFALLKSSTTDEALTYIQDELEAMSESISGQHGYEDVSDLYVGRDSETFVSYLGRFVKFNLDSHSLKQDDADLEPVK